MLSWLAHPTEMELCPCASTATAALDSLTVPGTGLSTFQIAPAPWNPSMPLASVTNTASWCGPSATFAIVYGDEHATRGPPSSEQANVEPGLDEWNANVAVVT